MLVYGYVTLHSQIQQCYKLQPTTLQHTLQFCTLPERALSVHLNIDYYLTVHIPNSFYLLPFNIRLVFKPNILILAGSQRW